MIEKVISGGQTGADQAGWRAAKAAGIATGGWMPKGFLTEEGPRPEFAELYGAMEHEYPEYPARTRANINWCDGMILFGNSTSRGSRLALSICRELAIPTPTYICWDRDKLETWPTAEELASWVRVYGGRVLNIAGIRESSAPGIGAWIEGFLIDVFRLLKEQP